MTEDNMRQVHISVWIPIAISIIALIVSVISYVTNWLNLKPRLHVDSWRIHDAVEFYTSKESDLTELAWGITFEVHHAAGTPAELKAVEVTAKPPYKSQKPIIFDSQSPNRVVSSSTPYKSTIYNVPAEHTEMHPPYPRVTLLEVTIKYVDRRLFSRGTEYRETFHGRFRAGRVDGGVHYYIRAENWDRGTL